MRLSIAPNRRTLVIVALIFVIIASLFTVFLTQRFQNIQPPLMPHDTNTTIDYSSPIQKLDPIALGMDVSGFYYPNSFANDRLEQRRLKALGLKYMRVTLHYSIPGDTTSKIICTENGCDGRWSGDQWIQAIKGIGAEPVIVVPYDLNDAAGIVRHFNNDTHNSVHYWIIGNEPDLNDVSVDTYSERFKQDYDAMKAVDFSIKIGGGATAWYDREFLQAFLQQAGSRVDFVDFHGYPQQGNVAGDYAALFRYAAGYSSNLRDLRSLIQTIVPARSSQIGIEVGEWELNWGGSAQNNTNFHGLWAASVVGHILEAGGHSLFYADKGNALYGFPHTVTDSSGRVITIKLDDTNAAYHGIGMFTGEGLFQEFGNTMVNATTTLPDVDVFASDHAKNIVVINKNPSSSQTARIFLRGVTSGTVDVWRKDETIPFPDPPKKLGTLIIHNGFLVYPLTPFSMTTFILHTS